MPKSGDQPRRPLDGEEIFRGFDQPGLNSLEFFRRVMESTALPMQVRLKAAESLAMYEHPRLQQVSQDVTAGVTIRIEGGLPNLPGADIIMPGTEAKDTKPGNGAA